MFILEQEGININDVDWESMASDDNEDDDISTHTNKNNQIQSDENRDHFDQYSSSPSNNCSSSSDDIPEAKSFSRRSNTTLESAVLINFLRLRHSISKSCITDICHLLRLLEVSNMPNDYR
ncbi:unnamed protein product [Rotaria sp. Silwood2]|nr:unnamed protein product [Rotaria sp. Silwood2]CAF4415857.1 unnamed protein product [Rotaria sp. Silwood2]